MSSLQKLVFNPDQIPHIPARDIESIVQSLGDRYLGKGRSTSDFPQAKPDDVVYIPGHRSFYQKTESTWKGVFPEDAYVDIEGVEIFLNDLIHDGGGDVLGVLLRKEIIGVNNPHWDTTLSFEQVYRYVALFVVTNDLFGPYADGQDLILRNVRELFVYCLQYGFVNGPIYWAIMQRRRKPWAKGMQGLDPTLVERCVAGELIIE